MKEFLHIVTATWWGITILCVVCVAVWILLTAILYRRFFKRFYDIVLSLLAIIVFSPLLLMLTIVGAIKMKGNPFFVQKRPGRRKKLSKRECEKRGVPYGAYGEEKIIKLIKLRTMSNEKDESGNLLPDEKRLTKYGKLLRSTSLDELPSLFNILCGSISIVGPRPLLVRYLSCYTDAERHRHDIRPGLTGLAQVNGRNYLSWEEIFAYDLYYIEKISFFFDLKIIFQTAAKVLKRQDISEVTQNGGIDNSGRMVYAAFDIERKKISSKEIGSYFYNYDRSVTNKEFTFDSTINSGKAYLYKSGRNAIKSLCKHLLDTHKRVLLPNYTCNTVIQPFIDEKWVIDYYNVKQDFTIDEESLLNKISQFDPSVVFVQSYFGFNTLASFKNRLNEIKTQGITVIEDVTHSLFSDFDKCDADYFIASLRKFFAIPNGGVIFTQVESDDLLPAHDDDRVAQLAFKAFDLKKSYMENKSTEKEEFRRAYSDLQTVIEDNNDIVGIAEESIDVWNNVDFGNISNKRRSNYKHLIKFLHIPEITVPLAELGDDVVPLYFPILLRNSIVRDELQKYLISFNIYCPIIWGKPTAITQESDYNLLYDMILCIPVDQRYTENDMQIVINLIKSFFEIWRLRHKK